MNDSLVNALDIASADAIILSKESVKSLEKRLIGKSKEKKSVEKPVKKVVEKVAAKPVKKVVVKPAKKPAKKVKKAEKK